jgi:NAD(P)H-dependent FMN reductase
VFVTRILGISGSLRAGSYNTALLRAAQPLAGPSIELEVVTLRGIPLYDADIETREGLPEAVSALKQKIVASDGVLLATPEYNNGIPGGFGTILAQNGWLPVLRTLGVRYWTGGRLMVSRAAQVFDESGAIRDEAVRAQLGKFLAGFAAFAREAAVR